MSLSTWVQICANDLSSIVNSVGMRLGGIGRIDGRVHALAEQKSVVRACCRTAPYYIAVVVDCRGKRGRPTRDICKHSVLEQKANYVKLAAESADHNPMFIDPVH